MSTKHFIEAEELMAYLDGELPAGRASAAAAHVEHCADCQQLAAEFQGVARRLAAWEVEPGNVKMTPAMIAGLDKKRRRVHVPLWAWSAAAAVVVVIAIAPQFKSRPATDKLTSYMQFSEEQSSAPRQVSQPVHDGFNASRSAEPQANKLVGTVKPMIARSAQLTLKAKEVDKVRSGIDEVLKRHNGYIGELNSGAPQGEARSFGATLRFPADQFEAAFAELKKLGRVEAESQSGEEVTQQYIDLDARLTNARNSEHRLTALLKERTGRLADVLSVETEIERVRGEIESMNAEKKALTTRINFATVIVRVLEDYKAQLHLAPDSVFTRFRNAAVEGYRSMVEGLVGVLTLVLSWGPSLLLWCAVFFFPARLIWKKWLRWQASRL